MIEIVKSELERSKQRLAEAEENQDTYAQLTWSTRIDALNDLIKKLEDGNDNM